ncbi:MAG: ribosome small subunit-dependent GTPase A [Paludibacteraceae bacterium]|nr:ribosome small subunit-dependent GTPase A [Paludibacteraceae bacterium]
MEGLVIKNTGSWYIVRTEEGRDYACKVKGTFRLRDIRSTNPVAVGDRVYFETDKEETGLISDIADRKNYIIRRSSNLSKASQIIAANLDLFVPVVTVRHPETSPVFIDRLLVTAEAYGIPAVLVFNKIDLYDPFDLEYLEGLETLYHSIGYGTIRTSSVTGEGVDELRALLSGKVTLFSGNSGVGKSTLVNAMEGEEVARTNDISSYHKKGMHTTTFSEMYAMKNGGYIVDTPGVKGFGVVDMKKDEISHYFPEIFRESKGCRFANCQHINEPGCAVKEAVESHVISESRYNSYLSIRDDESESKYR